ncbi:hypothetical protein A3860_10060 [Niastella vici]|uniref:Uncharacterized protein n=1 Tax=Niastella vici TaxID=1703345 RepID=A0A1V9FEX2_9BACT|nr:hypothetical protein A3860_10060 [Niastella vici]
MLTRYVWIYSVLIWLAVSFYIVEVTSKGSVLFTLTALGLTTAYILGVGIWTWFRKNKKQLQQIDDIMYDLEQLHDALS